MHYFYFFAVIFPVLSISFTCLLSLLLNVDMPKWTFKNFLCTRAFFLCYDDDDGIEITDDGIKIAHADPVNKSIDWFFSIDT